LLAARVELIGVKVDAGASGIVVRRRIGRDAQHVGDMLDDFLPDRSDLGQGPIERR
jgi:hypothetical protein